ncbi:hypothetical protein FRX31_002232 [Thalictrum thalictroides]|uniref:Uncharacterized protein n=1 Tax=Thalictrum thalictroides TaxID=46969 RepID=A0A7J6XEF1_THATH|nr:hypothetical protein FRX31_002232 [Thalictrum thalictroides]
MICDGMFIIRACDLIPCHVNNKVVIDVLGPHVLKFEGDGSLCGQVENDGAVIRTYSRKM